MGPIEIQEYEIPISEVRRNQEYDESENRAFIKLMVKKANKYGMKEKKRIYDVDWVKLDDKFLITFKSEYDPF